MSKCKCPPAGAPEWVLTYGDMMSLLLCFFILLAALSELKKDLRPASNSDLPMNLPGQAAQVTGPEGNGSVPIGLMEKNDSFVPLLDAMVRLRDQQKAEEEERKEEQAAINALPPETLYQIGGSIIFEPYSSAVELDAQRKLVRSIAEKLKGYTAMVEIRGHASSLERAVAPREYVGDRAPAVAPSGETDIWLISHQRAAEVMRLLLAEGVPQSRMKITAAGDAEPLLERLYNHAETRLNRRVEVLLSNHTGSKIVRTDP